MLETADRASTRVKIGELVPTKACTLLPESRQTPFVQDYCQAVDYLEQAIDVASQSSNKD